MTARPDIVLLVLDTQRIDRLSCYGHPTETTPYLDAVTADATRFTQAYSAAQWTIPSHSSMFTGLYPDQHHMLHAYSFLPATFTTLAERLTSTGYLTTAFCNNPLIGVVNTGLQRGFQSFLNYSGLITSRPNQGGLNPTLMDRYRQHFKRHLVNVVNTMQDVFAHSDTLLDLSFSPLIAPLWQTALSFKGNTARSLNDAAKFLVERRGVEKKQPIFSFINLMGVHMPYHPPAAVIERFAPQFQQDKNARRYLRQFNSDVFGWITPLTTSISEQNKAILDGMYNAEVANQDELVGEFIQKLQDSGTLDNTLLIICADHGEQLGEKQLMGHGVSLYNTLVHVPLIIRDPSGNFPRGATVNQVVSTRRVFHTVLAAAGEATAAEEAYTLAQSPSSDPDRSSIYALGVTPQNMLNVMKRRRPELIEEGRCDQPRRAVWNERYKLIQTGSSELELYDIFDDPNEEVNLRDILPEQVEMLREQLQAFINHVDMPDAAENASATYNDPHVQHRLHNLGYLEE